MASDKILLTDERLIAKVLLHGLVELDLLPPEWAGKDVQVHPIIVGDEVQYEVALVDADVIYLEARRR